MKQNLSPSASLRLCIKILTLASCFAGLFPTLAASSISDVLVSQRWPWNEKVDVDFTLTGEKADVDVSAAWDGQSSVLLGTLFDAAPGANRFTWDPSSSAWAGKTLTGFSVTLAARSSAEDAYLIADLEKGGYSFLSDVPAGGWGSEYKTKKMVFRRIPAGTYTNGMTAAELTRWYGASTVKAHQEEKLERGARTQTFSSDFYLAIFQMTEAQYEAIETGAVGTGLLPKTLTYEALRGSTNATDGICWPTSKYAVATSSFLAKLRSRIGAGLTIDLPSDEQWEVAARANTTTVFPNGGTTNMTDEALWGIFGTSDWYYGNGGTDWKDVGLKGAVNAWGFYDMFGNGFEWTLDVWRVDAYGRPVKAESGTDPAGYATWKDASKAPNYSSKINAAYGMRVVRSARPTYSSHPLQHALPSMRTGLQPQTAAITVRFCIHLKPLAFPE